MGCRTAQPPTKVQHQPAGDTCSTHSSVLLVAVNGLYVGKVLVAAL